MSREIVTEIQLLKNAAKTGYWKFDAIHPVYRIAGKTIGIIGFGRIGSTVYRMLNGFGARFLIVDPYINESRKKEFGIQTSPFECVIKEADIITVHVPLIWSETYHMFDDAQFEVMKPTAILVNTSRGAIVNLISLDKALLQGKLAMAGIDVYEEEPPSTKLTLLSNPKAICTPHLSWLSEESGLTIRHKIIDNIRRFRDGEKQLYR